LPGYEYLTADMAGTMMLVVILSLEENFGNGEVSHSVKNALVFPRKNISLRRGRLIANRV